MTAAAPPPPSPLSPPGPSFGPAWLARLRGDDAPGEVVTFYSYKGGTGRSMALVNCAGLIAQHLPATAKPLLLVDFDLEAPGLHRYLAPHLQTMPPPASDGGVLELFSELRAEVDRALADTPRGSERRLDDEAVARLVDAAPIGRHVVDAGVPGMKLLRAGRFDDSYDRRLTRFDWEGLHAQAPALFRCLAERWSRDYSFVFVDSRTGLSDTSGICTMLLPDVLVMVFTPNQQSLTGIEHLVRRAADYRSGAADSRPLRVYPLPSRVDNQVEHFRQTWRMGAPEHPLFGTVAGYQPTFEKILETVFGLPADQAGAGLTSYFDVVQVPHSADYSYGERLCFAASSASDSLSIRKAYENFLPWLATGAQPWQAPAARLLDQQAAIWLRDAGAERPPESNEEWPGWFQTLAKAIASLSSADVSRLIGSTEHGYSVAIAMTMGLAAHGAVDAARKVLQSAPALGDDDEVIVADGAPPALLRQLARHWPLDTGDADAWRGWVSDLDAALRHWQPMKPQRMRWLAAMADLAHAAGWSDAELSALRELAAITEGALGAEHEQTLEAHSRLAAALHAKGRHEEALPIDQHLLATRQRTLGETHTATRSSANQLATTLIDAGRYDEARQLLERSLTEIPPDSAGEAEMWLSMTALARLLLNAGELPRAGQLLQQVLDARTARLGPEHPDTLGSLSDLAALSAAAGDVQTASAMLERVLEGQVRVLGEADAAPLSTLGQLAALSLRRGDTDRAEALMRRAVEGWTRLVGPDDDATLDALGGLAGMLLARGDAQGALAAQERVVATRLRRHAQPHRPTLDAQRALANTLAMLGQSDRALDLQRQVLDGRRRLHGDDHAETQESLLEMAYALLQRGDADAAEGLIRQLLAIRQRQGHENDETSLAAEQLLAQVMLQRRQLPEAITLQHSLLERAGRTGNQQMVAAMTNNLATMLRDVDDLPGSLALFEDALKMLSASNASAEDRWRCALQLAGVAVELERHEQAAAVLDAFTEPRLTIDNPSWISLRLRVADRLGDRPIAQRLSRRQSELISPRTGTGLGGSSAIPMVDPRLSRPS